LTFIQGFREQTHDVSQRGAGNAVSLEFDMLYRWHAAISRQDEAWIEHTFEGILPGKDPSTVRVSVLIWSFQEFYLLP
jgi:linoleate 10R-lipoxygenase